MRGEGGRSLEVSCWRRILFWLVFPPLFLLLSVELTFILLPFSIPSSFLPL